MRPQLGVAPRSAILICAASISTACAQTAPQVTGHAVFPTPSAGVAHVDVASSRNVYASTMSGRLSPAVAGIAERVYVPDSKAGIVTVIDPASMVVLAQLHVGRIPHHITPAHDLSRLYVDSEGAWNLGVLDPRTNLITSTIAVPDPYNLYFTPQGNMAVVVQENLRRLEFRDSRTWQVIKEVPMPVRGADHLDFTADGRYLLVSLEFTGALLKVDTSSLEVVGYLAVGGLPVDVRLSPDGSVFFVTNQRRNGVSVVDPVSMKEVDFIPTDRGAHGLYISRDTQALYVTNRLAGTISVIDIARRVVTATWRTGGSPDMIQLNPAGTQLWTSSRFDGFVMVVDTRTGSVIKRIYCGPGAHGLSYFPAPGEISLGHNGVYR